MKRSFITLLLTLIISFGANAQYNYHFSETTKPVWGNDQRKISITLDFTLDSLYKNIVSQNKAFYGIHFSYRIRFFENNIELPSNFKYNFYNLRVSFPCGTQSTEHGLIPEISNSGYSGSALAYNSQPLKDPHNATLESLGCNVIKLIISGPGINSVNYLNPNSALPIELINFDAYKKGRDVELIWKTASETNNDYFTIERSIDGFSWERMQTVKGAGNSTRTKNYSWIDNSPYTGISYYRLKQTDYDGTTEVFNIVSVDQKEIKELKVYPNPVLHSSTLLGVNENEAVRIFNTVGVEVTGNVNISTSPSEKTYLDMSQLPKGMYYVLNGDRRIQLLKE